MSPTSRPADTDGRPPSRWSKFYAIVRQIPRGSVATYGQVASLAGHHGHARQVGYALAALLEEEDLPWHRVINARGEVSPRARSKMHEFQRSLLEAEGVVFHGERVSLRRYQWQPDPGEES